MNYLIVNPSTGQILQKSFSSQGVAPIPPTGMSVVSIPDTEYATLDASKSYLDMETGELIDKPPKPSDNHVFDYLTKSWYDPRTLAELKQVKWESIKKCRETAEFGPFQYNGMVFDGDVDAQRRLSGYISISKGAIASEQAFSAVFTLANNTEVLLTAQDFVGIEIAKVSSVAAAFSKAADLRKQIEAAGTLAELNAINW